MAITINGSGTITGVSAGGLPDNCITADDLATTLDLSGNTITLPSGTGGKVLQVVRGIYNTTSSVSSYSWVDTGLSATITPTASDSEILIIVNQPIVVKTEQTGTAEPMMRIVLGAGNSPIFEAAKHQIRNSATSGQCFWSWNAGLHHLDQSVSSTDARTYKTQFITDSAYVYAQVNSGASEMILMEIAG